MQHPLVGISRRELLSGAGKAAAGLAIVSAGGLGIVSDAEAKRQKYPWPYKKLDPKPSAKIAGGFLLAPQHVTFAFHGRPVAAIRGGDWIAIPRRRMERTW